jgi:hypothetical protein
MIEARLRPGLFLLFESLVRAVIISPRMKKRLVVSLLALPLLLGSCGTPDLSSLLSDSSFAAMGETLSDDSGNSIVVKRGILYRDGLLLEATLMAKDYVFFSYQILPIGKSYLDREKTNALSNSWLGYGRLQYKNPVSLNLWFTGVSSLDDTTTYYINFGITKSGYHFSYFTFQGSEILR